MNVRAQILRRRQTMAIIGKAFRPRLGKPPKMAYPRGIELQYIKALRNEVAALGRVIADVVYPQLDRLVAQAAASAPRADALADDVDGLSDEMRRKWAERIGNIRTLTTKVQTDISSFNANQVAAQAKSVLGVDVLTHEPWLAGELSVWSRSNAALIKNIGDKAIANVDRIVTDGVQKGLTTKQLRAEIKTELGITNRRATVIARDQTGKLNGRLTQLRHQNMGVSEYIWRGAMDHRERPKHRALEGKRRKYGEGIIPGEEVLCRCYAEPVFDEFADLMGPSGQSSAREAATLPVQQPTNTGVGMTTGPLAPETLAEKVKASDYFADVVQSEGIPKGLKDELIANQHPSLQKFLAAHKPVLEIQRSLQGPTGPVSGSYSAQFQKIYVAADRQPGSFGNRFVPGEVWSVSYGAQSAPSAVQRTLTHEIAHHVHNVYRDQIDPLLQDALTKQARRPITMYADDGDPTGVEYFAETFTAYIYHRGRLREFDPVGYDLIGRVLSLIGMEL